jgi:long-subunit acyl-CoA synthetase (AMP-forming)
MKYRRNLFSQRKISHWKTELLTQTMKLKRNKDLEAYKDQIEKLYQE